MAITGQEIEIVGPGIKAENPQTGPYVQNMIWDRGSWETRKGFGIVGEWDSTLSKLNENVVGTSQGIFNGYHKHLGSYLMKTDFGHRQIISIFAILGWTSDSPHSYSWDIQANMFAMSIYDITTRTRWEEILIPSMADSSPISIPQDSVSTENRVALMPHQKGYYDMNGVVTQNVNITEEEHMSLMPIQSSSSNPDTISFIENKDVLFFGNSEIGFYYYKPAAFIGNRGKALDPIIKRPYSESSLINSLRLTPGVFSAAYTYATFLENLSGLTSLGLRLVYIAKNRLYFSDINKPASIIDGHYIDIPSEASIVAAQEINGNLVIWTRNETFLYQPNAASDFVNTGVVTKISENIGCISAGSFTKFENTVMWISETGVYSNSGDLAVGEMSKDIRVFFTNYLSNPLAHYQTDFGAVFGDSDLPKIQHNAETLNATITYCDTLKGVLVTFPDQRCSLLMSQNMQWSLWNYDSSAFHDEVAGRITSDTNSVGTRKFMDCQQILADSESVYAIGLDIRNDWGIYSNGIQVDYAAEANVADGLMPGGRLVDRRQRFRSYFITEYGRGGGCDRNIDNEDYRYGIGEYKQLAPSGVRVPPQTGIQDAGYFKFIIGKPQKIEPGWSYQDKGTTRTFDRGGMLVPIIIDIDLNLLPRTLSSYLGSNQRLWFDIICTRLELEFQYDRSNWQPAWSITALYGPKINCFFKTPMENVGAGCGNGEAAFIMTPNYEQMNYNAVTGLASDTGNLFKFVWSGVIGGHLAPTTLGIPRPANISTTKFITPRNILMTGAGPSAATPDWQSPLPIIPGRPTTICWVPFEKITDNAVSGLAIENMRGVMYTDNTTVAPVAGDHYRLSNNIKWEASSMGQRVYETDGSSTPHIQDNVTQGVDWAYLSPPIGLGADKGGQLKARGLYSTIKSRGISSEPIKHSWTSSPSNLSPRLFNTTISADGAEWQGQVIDQQPVAPTPGRPSAIRHSDTLVDPGAFSNTETQSQSIRTKIRSGQNNPRYKVFGQDSNLWGQKGTRVHGTVLIDDPQMGTIAESNSTRGEWFSWMMFGYVLDKAEAIVIKGAKAILRSVSGRRRRGHNKE